MFDSIVSVTTPAPSRDLTTLATLKTMLGISTTEHDTRLTLAIKQCSASIDGWCGRIFAQQRYTETWRLERSPGVLFLRQSPVKDIVLATIAGSEIASSGYEVEQASGMLYRLQHERRTTWPATKIVIAYDAGYVLPSFSPDEGGPKLPADVEKACLQLAKMTWYMMPVNPLLRSEDIPDVYSVGYALPGAVGGMNLVGGMPEEIAGLLMRYRNPKV